MRMAMESMRDEIRELRHAIGRPHDNAPTLAEIDRELTDMERADRG
jgi:hypothetical protein